MVFRDKEQYLVIEKVRPITYMTPEVEFAYRNNHTALRDYLPGFDILHAQGYEAILGKDGLVVVHYLRERPTASERVFIAGLDKAATIGLGIRLNNIKGEETFSGILSGAGAAGRLLLTTLSLDEILIRDTSRHNGSKRR